MPDRPLLAPATYATDTTSNQSARRRAATSAKNVCAKPSRAQAGCTAQVLLNKQGRPLTFKIHKLRLTAAGARAAPKGQTAYAAASGVSTTEPAAMMGTPQWLQQAYDLTALSATAGYGDTVGIVDAGVGYNDIASDLAQYRAAYNLPPCTIANGCLRVVDQNGGDNLPTAAAGNAPGWGFETALDVDAVSAICPNCHILLVEAANDESSGSLAAAEHTAYQLGANQISNSWLEWWPFSSSDYVFPGVATVAATGDYSYLSPPDNTPYPASLPGVTAAGGTALTPTMTPSARGVVESGSYWDSSSCSSEQQPPWQAEANGGCPTRATSDLSADGETDTGLYTYYSGNATLTGYTSGGTSLATALISAYYGLLGNGAGVGGAAWAYNNASALNDITAGSNAWSGSSCTDPLFSLCNAGVGYDGITGVGSISGAVVVGAPGVANGISPDWAGDPGGYVVSSTATSVTLAGGVYPNQLDTHYWWEYGTTTSNMTSTAHVDVGAGTAPVAVTDTVSGLEPGVSYDFALYAQNSLGTVSYGGADGFTLDVQAAPTPPAPPAPTATLAAATLNGPSAVTLSGTINPEGSLTTYYFTEGVADDTGACVPSTLGYGTDFPPDPLPGSLGNETTPFPVSQTITDLVPGVSYCFGLTAFNAGGPAVGADMTAPAAVAPTVAITSAPAASSAATTVDITYISQGASDTTSCTLDGSAITCDSGSANLSGLSVGSHLFTVTVSGPGGSTFAAADWETLPPAPTVALTATPPAVSANSSAEVDFSVFGVADSTSCTLDGAPTDCSSGSAIFTTLSVGDHTFTVTATGPGGENSATASWTVTQPAPVIPPAPSVALTSVPLASSANTSSSVSYVASGVVTSANCILDGAFTECGPEGADLTGLTVGDHTFVVTVNGPGGSNSATVSWTVTPPAPTVVLTSVPPTTSTNTSVAIAFAISGATTSTSCSIDSAAVFCGSGSVTLDGLSVGTHTFTVIVNGVGGSNAVSTTFTTTAPAPAPAPVPPVAPIPIAPTPPTPVPPPITLDWSALHLTPTAGCQTKKCAVGKFSFVLAARAQLTMTITHSVGGRTRTVEVMVLSKPAGPGSCMVSGLAPGRYQVTVQARSGAQHTPIFHAQLRVR
jgi:hypothetical protein